jgi:hypothetical protein
VHAVHLHAAALKPAVRHQSLRPSVRSRRRRRRALSAAAAFGRR